MEYYTIAGMVLICLIALGGIYFTVKSNAQKRSATYKRFEFEHRQIDIGDRKHERTRSDKR